MNTASTTIMLNSIQSAQNQQTKTQLLIQGKLLDIESTEARIEAALARIEEALARIEAKIDLGLSPDEIESLQEIPSKEVQISTLTDPVKKSPKPKQ